MNYIEVLRDELRALAAGMIELLPNLAAALVVLLITWLVAKGAVNIADRIIGKTSVRADLRELTETLVKLLIWIIGFLLAATLMVPSFTLGGMVAGLGIGAVAIGFAFQDIFENFLAGVLIMLRDKMQLGDNIETEGVEGKVEKITLRETHIRQFSGELTIMPNSMLFKNAVKIFTDPGTRRFQVMVGVSYDADLEQSRKVIQDAVASVEGIIPDKGAEVYARELGASSIDFLVRWWVDTKRDSLFTVQNDVVFAIKEALDEAGIEIPFPYMTHTFKDPVPVERAAKDEG